MVESRVRAATGMVLGSIVSVQCGAALATSLFDDVGSAGAVLLRSLFGALPLLALARRDLPPLHFGTLRQLAPLALIFAGMNLSFYAAIDLLPLGVAVTLEFIGPLGVAIAASRRPRDLLWVGLAAAGILLLSGGVGDSGFPLGGVVLALTAAAFWAAYIVQSAYVGSRFVGLGGLAVAMAVSVVLLAPPGIAVGGGALGHPSILAVGAAVGLLSSAIPYALEHEALRRLPKGVFGVLMSLEPAIAALVGFVALAEGLSALELLAIALVVVASIGALRGTRGAPARDV